MLVLGSHARANVGQGDRTLRRARAVAGAGAGGLHADGVPALPLQSDLADHWVVGLITAPQVVCQGRAVGAGDRAHEGPADQARALDTQQRGAGQVDLGDAVGAIECDIADRCEIVQLGVAVARVFERLLGLAQLTVLHLELNLVDVQLVEQVLRLGRRLGMPGGYTGLHSTL